MSPPFLSVLVPTYNGERFLRVALESIAREPVDGIEVLIADDGSSDGTLDIVRAFSGRLPIRLVRSSRVGNWATTSNVALREAAASYACFLHQDDTWCEGRMGALRSALARSPGAALYLWSAILIDDRGRRIGRWRCPLPPGRALSPDDFVERLLIQNFIAIPAPVFRVDAALRLGGLDASLWYTADWDLWLGLGRLGPVWYDPRPTVAFRIHRGSQTMARDRGGEEFAAQLRTALEPHWSAWAPRVTPRRAARVRRAAEFSVALNVALAAASRGQRASWLKILGAMLRLGPTGCARYVYHSRILDRLPPRLRLWG